MRIFITIIFLVLPFLSFSVNLPVDIPSLRKTMQNCASILQRVQLGTNLNNFSLPYHQPNIVRTPSRFLHEGKNITILYCRTGWIADDAVTDDEYTPLLFVDNILSAVGWEILGGPKTFGDRRAAERQRQWDRDTIDRQNRALKQLCGALGDPRNCNW